MYYPPEDDLATELEAVADSLAFWRSLVNIAALLMLLCGTTSLTLLSLQQLGLQNIESRVRAHETQMLTLTRTIETQTRLLQAMAANTQISFTSLPILVR